MASGRDLVRRCAKQAQWGLRNKRRLERVLRVGRLRGPDTRYSHELIIPMTSTYAPWHDDEAFREIYNAIDGHTFVDQYKCYELWEQLGQVQHVAGDILEVGVWRGGTGVLLARRAKSLGMSAEVFLADTFTGVAKAGEEDPWYKGGEHADTSPDVVRRLASSQAVDVTLLVGVFPDETAETVRDRRFRFAHIDVDTYESARDAFSWVWDRLQVGGVIIWDDYGAFECEGVATLGRQLFATDQTAGRLVHNLNGHLMLFKLADEPLSLSSSDR